MESIFSLSVIYCNILLKRSLFDGDSSVMILNASLFVFKEALLKILVISFALALIKILIIEELKFLELISLIIDRLSNMML